MSKEISVRLEFIEEVLGTQSNNKEVQAEYISSKAPNAETLEEEVAAVGVDATIEKGKLVFPRDVNGKPFLYDYQIRGFFKDACSVLRVVPKTKSSDLKAYKKYIDGLIFVHPRKIVLNMPKGVLVGSCQRPLRGQTAQGERISLANSETCPATTWCEFKIKVLREDFEDAVIEWLDYGCLKGIGGWRNSSKGIFTYKLIQ